ncbi:MAG: CPBP family intramembrane metalloprotease [Chloroflexi bacterium]|nr:CPBP family intramembrane metalloprotease [Chloroflexota bacterium]
MARDRAVAAEGAAGTTMLATGEQLETAPWRWQRIHTWWQAHEPQAAPYTYLAVITLAEYLTATSNPRLGLALHAVVLLALLVHGARMPDEAPRRFLWALILAPLIRILSLTLPLTDFPRVSWYFAISVPLIVTTALLSRSLGFTRRDLGLTLSPRHLPIDLALVALGLPLGYLEYQILQPDPLVPMTGWTQPLLAALILTVSTGFNEEFIFRGLMQGAAFPVLRRWSPLYVNLLFAALHMGYESFIDLVFVLCVGMLFSWYRMRSGSIFGITLAHGMVNITLFLIVPFLMGETTGPGALP